MLSFPVPVEEFEARALQEMDHDWAWDVPPEIVEVISRHINQGVLDDISTATRVEFGNRSARDRAVLLALSATYLAAFEVGLRSGSAQPYQFPDA